jgi:hypothetical protein
VVEQAVTTSTAVTAATTDFDMVSNPRIEIRPQAKGRILEMTSPPGKLGHGICA